MSDEEIKACATCTHVRGRRHDTAMWKDWECFVSNKTINIITGLVKYESCIDVRNDVGKCYITGAWYEKYVPPVRIEPASDAPFKGVEAVELTFDEASIAANQTAAADRLRAIKEKKLKGISSTDPNLNKL